MGTPDYGSGPEDHKKPPVVAGSDPEHDMDMAATSGISIDDRALLRKLDWRLMPLLCLTYALQSIDKTTLGYAAVLGLPSELGLTGTELSWAGGIMYLGYLVWEFPASVMLQRWPLPRVLAATTGLWGAVLCCHAAVSGFRGLAAVRALLGALESSVNPGTMLLMSMYYQRREQPFRMGIWIGSAGLGYILAGLVSFGIGHVGSGGYGDSSAPGAGGAGLSSWRIIFLFWGGITVLWAVLLFFTLPDSPARAKGFLNEHERAAVIDRVRVNGTGVENKTFKWAQFREALVDAKTWLLFLFAVTSNCPNGGLTVVCGCSLHIAYGR